jgi:hypothetical protein
MNLKKNQPRRENRDEMTFIRLPLSNTNLTQLLL